MSIKSCFFAVLFLFAFSVNLSVAAAVGVVNKEVAPEQNESVVGIQTVKAVKAVQIGLATGSQKWDSYGLYGCRGGCTKDMIKYCQCNPCCCYPCCCCGQGQNCTCSNPRCRCNPCRSPLMCRAGEGERNSTCSNSRCKCNPCRCYPVCRCGEEEPSVRPGRNCQNVYYCFKH